MENPEEMDKYLERYSLPRLKNINDCSKTMNGSITSTKTETVVKRFTINRNTGSDDFIDKFYQTFTEELTIIFLKLYPKIVVVVVQSLSHVQLFVTPWTSAYLASLSFTISQSLLRLMSIEFIELMIPSHPLLLPSHSNIK